MTGLVDPHSASVVNVSPELAKIVRAFCPIVSLHPKEKYLPCSINFFIERSHLSQRQKDGPRQVVIPRGELNSEKITSANILFEGCDLVELSWRKTTAKASLNDGYFLDLEHPADRTGTSAGRLSTVPVLCHVKRVRISKDAYVLELNYMFFFAYSGPYVVLGQERGGHDGDWEHITVRCEPDTGELIAVYYSAHRHGDGTWVPAEQVFFHSDTGRLLAFCALDGHGMHPKPQTNLRAFGVANELTSSVGRRWSSRKCIIVVPPGSQPAGPLTAADTPEVAARGGSYRKARPTQPAQYRLAPPAGGYDDGVVSAAEVEVEAKAMPFMLWKLRWGTSVSPQLQRWFQEAEHPSGSSTPRRLCIPCIKM